MSAGGKGGPPDPPVTVAGVGEGEAEFAACLQRLGLNPAEHDIAGLREACRRLDELSRYLELADGASGEAISPPPAIDSRALT